MEPSRERNLPSLKLKGKTPLSASIMAADKIRPAALTRPAWSHRSGCVNEEPFR